MQRRCWSIMVSLLGTTRIRGAARETAIQSCAAAPSPHSLAFASARSHARRCCRRPPLSRLYECLHIAAQATRIARQSVRRRDSRMILLFLLVFLLLFCRSLRPLFPPLLLL